MRPPPWLSPQLVNSGKSLDALCIPGLKAEAFRAFR